MGFIKIRGKNREIDTDEPQDLLIPEYNVVIINSILGEGVTIWGNVNIYGAKIDKNTKIAAFVEIRTGVKIGENVKIEPFVFIPEGVEIGNCVFLGPNVIFTNDIYPFSCNESGELKEEYKITSTIIEDNVSIGAQSVIKCGVTIGKGAMIGLGSTVIEDIPEAVVVYGDKARVRRKLNEADSTC